MNEAISQAVLDGIEGAEVNVVLEGNRALISVISPAFEGLTRVQKQQKVYACIDGFIKDGSLHAVTIRAETPD